MKKTDIILLTGLIGAILYSNFAQVGSVVSNLENDVLRMHILANSDSEEDQRLKLKVRDRLLECSDEIFGGCETLEDMESAAGSRLDYINGIVLQVIEENGFDYGAQTNLVNMDFDSRVYGNITMPAGNYEALRVTIGEAEGHNWWCVMYPPLCLNGESLEYADADMLRDVLTETVESDDETAKDYFSKEELDLMENPDDYQVKLKCVEVFKGLKSKIKKIF